jgi:site-specific DNA recombinase
VLLSFAQFEREVIGERVRDKIAASKRKGLWVGGPVPLGYRSIAKKLIVIEEEAEQVRTIFRRYLALGSIGLLIEDLHRCGVRPRPRVGRDGGTIHPTRFMVGPLAYLLKNRFYIGEVVYRGEVHPGEQQPIVEKELFEAVQAKLKHRAVTRKLRLSRSPSFLSGLLFDDRGNLMSPSHANKKGVRYRYYVSQAVLQNRKDEAGSIARVAAPDIEELVIAALRHQVEDIDRQVVPLQTLRWGNSATAISWLCRSSASCCARDISTSRSAAAHRRKGRGLQIPVRRRRPRYTCPGLRPAPRLERASPGSLRLRQISIRRRARRC